MSLPAEFLSEEQLSCSICLDIFINPVSTPCGHSFCLVCITSYWEGQSKTCLCPLCKENFRKRPELHINHTLKEITEQFKRMADTSMSPRNVSGDSLTAQFPPPKLVGQFPPQEFSEQLMKEMKNRFQRSASSELLPSHQLSEASNDVPSPPGMMKRCYSVSGTDGGGSDGQQCPKHGQCLELFCKTDQLCICTVCAETEHQGHSVGPAKREINIKKVNGKILQCGCQYNVLRSLLILCISKQSQLRIMEVELQGLITVREKKITEIQSSLSEIQVCASLSY